MHARLNGPTGALSLPTGASLLGRGHDCALRVNDPRLSRHHARFHFDGDNLAVEDAGSTNGVLVNGDRIAARAGLMHGDVVVCGPCVFTVEMDATRRASASELLPQPDGRQAHHSTESMEPIVVTPAEMSASKARKLDPKIAAALTGGGGETDSDRLLKPHEESNPGTSALVAPRRTKLLPPPLPPPQSPAAASGPAAVTTPAAGTPAAGTPAGSFTPVAEAKRKDRTTGLKPNDFNQLEKAALQADFGDQPARPRPDAWRRALAGVLDPMQTLLIVAALAGPALACGYALALARAGVILDQGLPRLSIHPVVSAGFDDLMLSLLRRDGLARAWELVGQLYQRDDQTAFLILFASATLAALLAVLVALLGLVASTVLRGAPWWHRRLGLELIEHRTGYRLTWLRALARWAVLALLWPLAPAGLALARSVHDLVSGCAVRARRS